MFDHLLNEEETVMRIVVEGDRAFRSARVVASLTAGWVRLGVFEDREDAEHWLEEREAWALPPSADWHSD